MVTQQQFVEMINTIKGESLFKTYLPVFTTFAGLFFGFFLNTIKDSITDKRKTSTFKKVVKDEVFLALDDALSLAKRVCNSLDEAEFSDKSPYVYVTRISDFSFKEFYPKIISSCSTSERKNLNAFYSSVDFINSNMVSNGTAGLRSEAREGIDRLNDLMIAIFTAYRCHGNLYCGKNDDTLSIGAFFRETGIKSNFYQGLIKRASKEKDSKQSS